MQNPLMNQITLDTVLKKVGDSNKYQTFILLIFLGQWLVSVFVIFGPLYFLSEPIFQCPNGEKCENEDQGCKNGAILYDPQPYTMSIEFGLYCGKKYLASTASSLTFIGSVAGNFIFSFLAEKYGRRIIMISAWGCCTIGVLGIATSVNPYMLITFIFIAGLGIIPSNALNLVIVGEQFGNKYRQKATTVLLMSWSIFEIILSGIAYELQNWRKVYIYFTSIISVIVFVGNFYLSESPKFLMTKDRKQELLKSVNQIAKKNNKQHLEIQEIENAIETYKNNVSNNQEEQKSQYHFWDLFRIKSLRYITIASCTSMLAAQLIYYSTQFSLNSIGANVYVNACIVAVGECFAYILSNRIIIYLQRKKYTIIFMLTSNLLCLLSFVIKINIYQTILAALIRVSNCLVFAILHVYIQELFATPVRSIGVGLQMGVGLIGSASAPFLTTLFKDHNIEILGGIGLIAIPFNFGNLWFKETKGLKLKDRIEENDQEVDNTEEVIEKTQPEHYNNYMKQTDEEPVGYTNYNENNDNAVKQKQKINNNSENYNDDYESNINSDIHN